MAAHEFASGQKVELSPSAFDGNAPRGSYVALQHRIKNARDGHERVVRESQPGQS